MSKKAIEAFERGVDAGFRAVAKQVAQRQVRSVEEVIAQQEHEVFWRAALTRKRRALLEWRSSSSSGCDLIDAIEAADKLANYLSDEAAQQVFAQVLDDYVRVGD